METHSKFVSYVEPSRVRRGSDARCHRKANRRIARGNTFATCGGYSCNPPTRLSGSSDRQRIPAPTLISEWRGRDGFGVRRGGSAQWNAINVALSPNVHVLGKTRLSVRNLDRCAAKHVDRPPATCVGSFKRSSHIALPRIKCAVQPLLRKIGFR
jgi:hypothetical protein